MAYKIRLPQDLNSLFLDFHVSQLRKCLRVPEQRIEPRGIKLKVDLEYKEQPVGIVDTKPAQPTSVSPPPRARTRVHTRTAAP